MIGETEASSFEKFIVKNTFFILALGLCPALAVTKTFEGAYVMGIIVLTTLFISSLIASILAKFVKEKFHIYVSVIITALIVTGWELFLDTYTSDLSNSLGIYVSIVAVNFMILQRVLFYAFHNNIRKSIMDALKMGISFALILSLVGLLREIVGNNTITLMDKTSSITGYIAKYHFLPENNFLPNSLFITSAGAFMTLGLILGIITFIRNRGGHK